MGLFDKLFVPEEEFPEEVKGGAREGPTVQQNVPNYDEKLNISGSAAEDIMKNALAALEGRETTVYTLQNLVSTLPTGVKKDSILGVLDVTKISVEEIQRDAQERISILGSVEKKLQEKVAADISKFEAEIKDAENQIEENRKKKAEAEALLREFQMLKSKTTDEVKSILTTIE